MKPLQLLHAFAIGCSICKDNWYLFNQAWQNPWAQRHLSQLTGPRPSVCSESFQCKVDSARTSVHNGSKVGSGGGQGAGSLEAAAASCESARTRKAQISRAGQTYAIRSTRCWPLLLSTRLDQREPRSHSRRCSQSPSARRTTLSHLDGLLRKNMDEMVNLHPHITV